MAAGGNFRADKGGGTSGLRDEFDGGEECRQTLTGDIRVITSLHVDGEHLADAEGTGKPQSDSGEVTRLPWTNSLMRRVRPSSLRSGSARSPSVRGTRPSGSTPVGGIEICHQSLPPVVAKKCARSSRWAELQW